MSETEKTPVVAAAKPIKETVRKPAAKAETADAFAFGTVDVPEAFRDVAEKAVKQAKDSYEKLRVAAEEATDLIEDQIETARSGFTTINGKAIDAAKANADAAFKFAKDLLTVKTVAEVIELQSAFARVQFDLVSSQLKELQELTQKVATEATQPTKDAYTKFLKDIKVA